MHDDARAHVATSTSTDGSTCKSEEMEARLAAANGFTTVDRRAAICDGGFDAEDSSTRTGNGDGNGDGDGGGGAGKGDGQGVRVTNPSMESGASATGSATDWPPENGSCATVRAASPSTMVSTGHPTCSLRPTMTSAPA